MHIHALGNKVDALALHAQDVSFRSDTYIPFNCTNYNLFLTSACFSQIADIVFIGLNYYTLPFVTLFVLHMQSSGSLTLVLHGHVWC